MFRNLNIWFISSLLISIAVLIPIITVFLSFFEETSSYYEILKDTFLFEYIFSPARATAPDGSERTLVSSNMSLTAAQTSSILTVITSSTHSFMTSRLFFPT